MQEIIVGAGRIGTALAAAGDSVLVRRGESIVDRAPPGGSGPIYVCTRNRDLAGVIKATPASRREDLVFVQNGMIETWLEAQGLGRNTQALLYFAVSRVGDTPVDGGRTVAWGPHAGALAARMARLGLACRPVDRATFRGEMIEKFLWNCVFGLLCQATGETVGALASARRGEVEALTLELVGVCERALGARPAPGVVDRLCAYSMDIADYRGAVKELPWRNGWLVERERSPLHARWLEAAGVAL